jgi:hypothetical protein
MVIGSYLFSKIEGGEEEFKFAGVIYSWHGNISN